MIRTNLSSFIYSDIIAPKRIKNIGVVKLKISLSMSLELLLKAKINPKSIIQIKGIKYIKNLELLFFMRIESNT